MVILEASKSGILSAVIDGILARLKTPEVILEVFKLGILSVLRIPLTLDADRELIWLSCTCPISF